MMQSVNIDSALEQIAGRFGLNAAELKAYAAEDDLGGYHPLPEIARWPMGSIFGVEGQVLYALVRATKPQSILNVGTFHGASAVHMAAALVRNNLPSARLYAVDINLSVFNASDLADDMRARIVPVESDAIDYLNRRWPAKVGLIFEDLAHTAAQVQSVWEIALKKANRGALIVSHDISHRSVGQNVQDGITAAGIQLADGLEVLIEPSDCGLFLYRQTADN